MTLDNEAVLRWSVPPIAGGKPPAAPQVVLRLRDAGGGEIRHAFTLRVIPPAVKPATVVAAPAAGSSPAARDLAAKGQVVVTTPAPFDQVVTAGGGRYLLLYQKSLKQVAVFDARELKVVKSVAPEGISADVLVAGGRDKLFVVDRAVGGKIQRWDLAVLRPEQSEPLPPTQDLTSAVTGSDSDGLILLGANLFLDPRTLKPVQVQMPAPLSRHSG